MKKVTKKIFGCENLLRLAPSLKQLATEAELFDYALWAGFEL